MKTKVQNFNKKEWFLQKGKQKSKALLGLRKSGRAD
jgi:hypothetical protein